MAVNRCEILTHLLCTGVNQEATRPSYSLPVIEEG